MFALATSIQPDTSAYHVMHAARRVSSIRTMAFTCSQTPSLPAPAKNRSTFTPSDSKPGNYGVRRHLRVMRYISIYGMTTLTTSKFESLPKLPKDEGGPVFAEPWEAQAFAMAVKLSQAGCFTWKE